MSRTIEEANAPAVAVGVHVTDALLAALDAAYPCGWLPDPDMPTSRMWTEVGKRRLIAFLRHCKAVADETARSPTNHIL